MTTTIEPGIIDGLSNSAYHGARDWLGSTSLKTLALKTPAHYKYESANPKESDAFLVGTAFHSLTLEDDRDSIELVDAATWTGKAAKEAKNAAIANGKNPLLAKDMPVIEAMRDAVFAHPLAKKLFTGHVAEQSFFWEEDGLKLKARPDAQNLGLIGDLKSCLSADPKDFARTAYSLGYFMSAAHYQDGVYELTGERLPFVFVNVEKTKPHLVSVIELDQDALDHGHRMLDRAKRIYRECTETGNWPGYAQYSKISLPRWAEYELEELEDE